MICFLLIILSGSFIPGFAGAASTSIEVSLNARKNIKEKVLAEPAITLEHLVRFANAQILNVGLEVPFVLNPREFEVPRAFKTSCNTYEVIVPLKKYSPASISVQLLDKTLAVPTNSSSFRASQITFNTEKFLRVGIYQPYSVDFKNKKFNFIYNLEIKNAPELNWWTQIIERIPKLKVEDPFLLIQSTAKGLQFTDDIKAYNASEHHETRPTKEEWSRQPFSRVFLYVKDQQRIQLPEKCL